MFSAIAFDLDDTLMDTSGLLAPKATRNSFNYLIENELNLSFEQCEKHRLELIKTISHRDVFKYLAEHFGTVKTKLAVATATQLFYEPVLPETLPLLAQARENLNYLKNKYPLYLVTAGSQIAQLNKAAALGIANDFEKIYVVNSGLKEKKKTCFLEIIHHLKIGPEELLCVGNSITSEIHDSLEIGATACYFEFGEDRGDITSLKRKPHFHIKHHKDLISTCLL